MSDTKKREGWLPPRTGGYVPTRRSGTAAPIQSAGTNTANAPKGGGGVGNIHLKKRDTEESE